jgi:molybdopterin converting factor small subunit
MPKELIDSLRFDAVMLSVNQVMADWDHVLNDGDELAFLPPFSGG